MRQEKYCFTHKKTSAGTCPECSATYRARFGAGWNAAIEACVARVEAELVEWRKQWATAPDPKLFMGEGIYLEMARDLAALKKPQGGA